MLSRRSMLRALGLGVPATAVAAAAGVRDAQLLDKQMDRMGREVSVGDLSLITANMGVFDAGSLTIRFKSGTDDIGG